MTELSNAVAAKGGQMAIRPSDQPNMSSSETTNYEVAPRLGWKSRRVRRAWITGCLGALALGASGCGSLTKGVSIAIKDLHECVDESMVDYRNRALAEKAWIRIRHSYLHHQYHRDLKSGFVAGYLDVANGGNGCCPAMAPSEYWGWRYQSPYGQAAVNAWFQGYPQGAKAAEQDGIGNWQSVRMNLRTPVDGGLMTSEYGSVPGMPGVYYPGEEEVVPVPQPASPVGEPQELMPPLENEIEILEPESVFLQPSVDEPWQGFIDDSKSVKREEADASQGTNRIAELSVPDNGTQPFSDAFVNDLFGPPLGDQTENDSGELPFSFE